MARQKASLLNVRIETQIKVLAQKAATDDRRTLTSLIESLLVRHLREHGYMPAVNPNNQGKAAPS